MDFLAAKSVGGKDDLGIDGKSLMDLASWLPSLVTDDSKT